jgi:endonuclease V-like protein UPF0215 family
MSSKNLNSILNKMPSATALVERSVSEHVDQNSLAVEKYTEMDRIVATIPKVLKEEIQQYVKSHKGETEKIVVLKALKIMGFNVLDEWLIDKRSLR